MRFQSGFKTLFLKVHFVCDLNGWLVHLLSKFLCFTLLGCLCDLEAHHSVKFLFDGIFPGFCTLCIALNWYASIVIRNCVSSCSLLELKKHIGIFLRLKEILLFHIAEVHLLSLILPSPSQYSFLLDFT